MLKNLNFIWFFGFLIVIFSTNVAQSKFYTNNKHLALDLNSYKEQNNNESINIISNSDSIDILGNNIIGNIFINKDINNELRVNSVDPVESNSIKELIAPIGRITNVEASNENGNTILTFFITKDFATKVKVVNFPFRVMFDAPMPYEWAVPEKSLSNPNLTKAIDSISYGNPDSGTFRVLANLKYPININRAFITADEEDNYKFVVDFRQASVLSSLLDSSTVVVPQTKEYYALLEHNAVEYKAKEFEEKREVAIHKWIDSYLDNVNYPMPVMQGSKNNNVIVVIDPGHGGKDPGAISTLDPNLKEKDVVLSISNMIANNLLKNPNISVILTRRGDYFVPLKDRVLWAKRFNADIFVSIHADRAPNEDSSGLSVYTLSQNASDAQTQVIATNENKSDIIAGLSDNEDTEVSRILINLLQRVKINDSVNLAQAVLNAASESITLLPHPIRSAGFVVLQVPETPSILIETGFLSNEKDAKNLASPSYQKIVASKISNGIESYLINSGKIKN